jgi:hypothetical protein
VVKPPLASGMSGLPGQQQIVEVDAAAIRCRDLNVATFALPATPGLAGCCLPGWVGVCGDDDATGPWWQHKAFG